MTFKTPACALAAMALVALGAQRSRAAVLYSENFDVDPTANWTVNDPALTDITADFHYDYSAIGVPAAPGGSSTRGLKMTANNSAGVFGGFSVSPTGKNFTGDYKLEFDMWQNYVGPLGPGGSGTTQFSMYGIGTSGTTPVWIGSTPKESVGFGTTLDGGSGSDYRAYSSAANTSYAGGNAVYSAPGGAINNTDAYYAVYGPQSAPAAQVGLFPGQTGSTDAGETAFLWRHVAIDVSGGFATWSIDGTQLAKIDLSTVTLGGGDIFFGHNDTNGGKSTDPNNALLNITLIDNVKVTGVPEPATLGLLGMAVLGLAAARRRC
jgi:hypothetical protein